jgi:MFS transporter, DHA3 family, macrolide efflux protein
VARTESSISGGSVRGWMRRSPYRPVVCHPVLRVLLPGFAVSSLGDGLALVGIVVLAQRLTPSASLVGIAVAAATLPGALGALALGRWLRDRPGAQLAGWDALLRSLALAVVAAAGLAGVLGIGGYTVLLAVSSLLHTWGSAGRYTLLAQVLPAEHRLPGNAVLSALSEVGTIAGPPLAGLIIATTGRPAVVMALDAATFAVLAIAYGLARRRLRSASTGLDGAPPARGSGGPGDSDGLAGSGDSSGSGGPAGSGGLRVLLADRRLLGLLVLSFAFFAAFGPVYVALPTELADPFLLGAYYTAFGVGSLIGAAATGHLRRLRLTTTLLGVVLGFGLAMVPLALGAPVAVSLPAFAVAGAIWAPYTATSMALLQSSTGDEHRGSVLAANSAVLVVAVPLGTGLGGPSVEHVGARGTLAISTFVIIALGLLVALAKPRARAGTDP